MRQQLKPVREVLPEELESNTNIWGNHRVSTYVGLSAPGMKNTRAYTWPRKRWGEVLQGQYEFYSTEQKRSTQTNKIYPESWINVKHTDSSLMEWNISSFYVDKTG